MKKINDTEISFSFIRSPGPGGQNVNKVASGVLLRFNVLKSAALSDEVRIRLIKLAGKHLSNEGELLIKATRYRTQERNKQDALDRLHAWVTRASMIPKLRKKTRPTKASQEKRLQNKKSHSKTKLLRSNRKMD